MLRPPNALSLIQTRMDAIVLSGGVHPIPDVKGVQVDWTAGLPWVSNKRVSTAGYGGPGKMQEHLLGAKNKGNDSAADLDDVESKCVSTPSEDEINNCLRTLFHLDPDNARVDCSVCCRRGGRLKIHECSSVIVRLVRETGTVRRQDGLLGCYQLPPTRFEYLLLPKSDPAASGFDWVMCRSIEVPDLVLVWKAKHIEARAQHKLGTVVVGFGVLNGKGADRTVRYTGYRIYHDLIQASEFTQKVLDQIVVLEPDAHERFHGDTKLRDHGVKFRIDPENVNDLWDSITEHRPVIVNGKRAMKVEVIKANV